MQPIGTKDISTILSEKLTRLSVSKSDCCIFRVHKQLRSVNEKEYEPSIVSVGPYHHGKVDLQMMEAHKFCYLKSLLDRKNETVHRYVDAIKPLEREAREYYAESTSLDADEFVEMMIVDGAFIVELIRKSNMMYLRDKDDPIFKMAWIMNSLQRDLMLFENQLPFFVLCKLFDLIEVPNQRDRFTYLALRFFHDLFPGPGSKGTADTVPSENFKHLLGLIHDNWLPSSTRFDLTGNVVKSTIEDWRFIRCATELQDAGVMFEKNKEGSVFDISFRNGVLRIHPITIEDRTESFLRNLIAYEQYSKDVRFNFVTDYVKFLDCLIHSPGDVELLCRYGIIDNWLGGNEVVCDIFNKLTDSVTGPNDDFIYGEIFNIVNLHCRKPVNQWMAKLRQNYLHSPWGLISISAATLLLLLTVTQTIFAILSYHPSKSNTS